MSRTIEEIMGDPDSTYREKLESLRDYLAHELGGNRCASCNMSKLRTGDTASLAGKLKAILDDIEALPDPNEEGDEFDQLIARTPDWASAPEGFPPPPARS